MFPGATPTLSGIQSNTVTLHTCASDLKGFKATHLECKAIWAWLVSTGSYNFKKKNIYIYFWNVKNFTIIWSAIEICVHTFLTSDYEIWIRPHREHLTVHLQRGHAGRAARSRDSFIRASQQNRWRSAELSMVKKKHPLLWSIAPVNPTHF